jgi:uncharacterized membrane protein YfcA
MHYSVVFALLIGAGIGLLSGLFGVGGSSISTPLLRVLLEVPRLVALATPLPVTLPTALSGGLLYYRQGLVNRRVAFWTVAGGWPGVVLGSLATKQVSDHLLMALTALTITAIGLRVLRQREDKTGAPVARPVWQLMALGAVIGGASGLLANGGGFLLVPAFVLWLGMSMQEAAGTSLLCVALLAVPGTVVHWSLGHIDLRLALVLSLGVLPSTYLGAHWAVKVRAHTMLRAFGAFLVIFGSSIYFACSPTGVSLVQPAGSGNAAATNYDRKLRAFDKSTGTLLWETTLPFAANATPAVYEAEGRQFVVVCAEGSKGRQADPKGGRYIAFALPATH